MEKELYRENALSMIELVICSIKGEKPDTALIERLDLENLFKVCQEHILTACVAYALESAGIHDNAFTQAKEKAICKNILLDAERKKILARLEQEQIWYMPLKGAILKDWYPRLGMRQMSDNDILFDINARDTVRQIMQHRGFKMKRALDVVDEYLKAPIYNFEMHGELFMDYQVGSIADYYRKIKGKLLKDEDNSYGFHFSHEDFYLFMLAHEYKHFCLGGTGFRSLVDTYVFLTQFADDLDWAYIDTEAEKMGISSYEKKNRVLSAKVFDRENLDEEEQVMLDRYIYAGAYGTFEEGMRASINTVGEGSKAKYILHRLFPTMEQIRLNWPFFYRHKWLIPVLWIYRPIHGLLQHRKVLKSEVDYLRKETDGSDASEKSL